jgi:sulfur carrier protein
MNDTTDATIQVNGRQEPLAAATLVDLLAARDIGAEARGIAIALNGAVVPRAAWAETTLHAGDNIEIVRARQGG